MSVSAITSNILPAGGGGGGGIASKQDYTAGSPTQAIFPLSPSINVANSLVYLNGIKLLPADYTLTTSQLTLGTPTSASNEVCVIDFGATGSGGSGGSTDFLGLTDTPASYASQQNKFVIVNSAGNALEFIATSSFAGSGSGGGGSTDFTSLTDTPANYTGQSSKMVVVNNGETALEFVDTASIFVTKEEIQSLAASQTVVTLSTVTTASLAVYVEGIRLTPSEFTKDSATQITLAQSYSSGSSITLVNNDQAGNTGGGGGGSTTFTGLTDTPGSFSGQGGKLAIVNNAGTALEFISTSSLSTITEEIQSLAAGQTAVTMSTATTKSLAVYVEGVRLDSTEFTKDAPQRITLNDSYFSGSTLLLVNGDLTGTSLQASQVVNDSNVAGAFVDDALNNLSASLSAPAYYAEYENFPSQTLGGGTDNLWDTKVVDYHNSYNTSSGVYTAPISGALEISFIGGDLAGQDQPYGIYVNGSTRGAAGSNAVTPGTTDFDAQKGHWKRFVSAGDAVTIRYEDVSIGSAASAGGYVTFHMIPINA
jgi:uncharacterized membrane protein